MLGSNIDYHEVKKDQARIVRCFTKRFLYVEESKKFYINIKLKLSYILNLLTQIRVYLCLFTGNRTAIRIPYGGIRWVIK